jgi:hypothetical protein
MTHTSRVRASLALAAAFLLVCLSVSGEPVVSPTWGFSIDLPEGFQLSGGDRKNRFSFFDAASGASVDLVAYPSGKYASPEALIEDAGKRLLAKTEASVFDYRGRKAALSRLTFTAPFGPAEGWILAVELETADSAADKRPLLLMLAYGKAGVRGNEGRYLSALDSVSPALKDRTAPGPISAFSYPPKGKKDIEVVVGETAATATIDESDAEASKALVDREFALLATYSASPLWKEAWTRFYRSVWRDSYERLASVAFAVERTLAADEKSGAQRAIAEGTLRWIQGFKYERDLLGSDFVDLVTAATERRGDCDSRSMLLAIVLQRANVDAILMVSRDYGHAMAAVKTDGSGARFQFKGTDWIVAETTAKVSLGMIGKNVSDPSKWLGVDFPGLPSAGASAKN